ISTDSQRGRHTIATGKLLIFAAIQLEAEAIAEALGARLKSPIIPLPIEGLAMPIELHTIGIKAVRLPQNLKRDEVAGIIMAGLAGALDHSLRPGDVIVDEASIRLPGALRFKVGKFHTSEGIIASPDSKAILFR